MYMEEYLLKLSQEITEEQLPIFNNKKEHNEWKEKEIEKFKKMIGVDSYFHENREEVKEVITGNIEKKAYSIKTLYYESLSNLFVTGNLYIPKNNYKNNPAILYLCGHAQQQKYHYQEHARSLAKAGFVVLIIDTIQLGEVKGIHQGTYSLGYYHWISKGYTPVGIETWNAVRAIDFLSRIPNVDHTKIGVTGNSGGGAIAWWVTCVDHRVKATVSSCGTGTIHSHIHDKTINGHCDCMFPNNPYNRSFISMYALAAPNPVLIVTPEHDKHFNFKSVRYVYDRLNQFYKSLNAEDNIKFFSFPGAHGYSTESRKRITQFFLQHLQNKSVATENIQDFDGEKETEEKLRVYHNKLPANDESTFINERFIPEPNKPYLDNSKELKYAKKDILANIRKNCFSIFDRLEKSNSNQTPTIHIKQCSVDDKLGTIRNFSYVTENDYSLTGMIRDSEHSLEIQENIAIQLRHPHTAKNEFTLIEQLGTEWTKVCLNVRGTDVTSWPTSLDWYIRRSLALCGTSITALRVWDTLQGVKALRNSFKGIKKVVLAGKGEMAVVAILSALFDDSVSAVILEEPPNSFVNSSESMTDNIPIEVVNIWRYADLSTVTALLWPALIIYYHKRPHSFRYTEEMYKKLGHHGGIWRLFDLKDLRKIEIN